MKHLFSKKNRALLSELVRTDFKLRYQNSVLGYLWSLLRPLFLFLILYVVFVDILKLGNDIPHYPVYLLLGIVMWNFFLEMTMQSMGSIVGRGDLIRKIRIPRWIIVVSSSLSTLINFLLNLIVVGIFIAVSHVGLLHTIWILPFILVELYVLSLGLSFFLAALFVKFRDINYIWEVLLQAGFYGTPIIYAMSRIHQRILQKLILLNPVAQIVQDARYVAITHKSLTVYAVFNGGWDKFIPFVIVIAVIIIGATYFRAQSKYFAENI